ncbi:hypothetical protein, partial [Streptomyces sp. NPDC059460]|uniref:hypothetical protein n=1 Tax=Streptomyces sp. NPDC059460 TaxID=3346840 RepID=UPI0036910A1B
PSASTTLLRQGVGAGLSPPLEPTAPHGANKIFARAELRDVQPARHGENLNIDTTPHAELLVVHHSYARTAEAAAIVVPVT